MYRLRQISFQKLKQYKILFWLQQGYGTNKGFCKETKTERKMSRFWASKPLINQGLQNGILTRQSVSSWMAENGFKSVTFRLQ